MRNLLRALKYMGGALGIIALCVGSFLLFSERSQPAPDRAMFAVDIENKYVVPVPTSSQYIFYPLPGRG